MACSAEIWFLKGTRTGGKDATMLTHCSHSAAGGAGGGAGVHVIRLHLPAAYVGHGNMTTAVENKDGC